MNYSNILKQTYTYKAFDSLLQGSSPALNLLGEICLNFFSCTKLLLKGKIHIKNTLDQMSIIAYDAIFIILTLSTVSGMIIALQIAYEMSRQGASAYIGMLVAISIVRELGPVMAAFALTAMVGSAIASEIATMKVTSQIDAMKMCKVNPIEFLMLPRILAGVTMLPLVGIIGNVLGIIGGMVVANITAKLNYLSYLESVWGSLKTLDISVSILKLAIFGILISLISSSSGYSCIGGAKEVGKATTTAVVWSFFAIVVFDYLISLLFFT